MSEEEKNIYKNIFEYPTKKIAKLEMENEQLQQENQQLKENNQAMQEEMVRTWEKLQQRDEVIEEAIEYTKNRITEDDYMLRTETKMVQRELLEILTKYKGDNNG